MIVALCSTLIALFKEYCWVQHARSPYTPVGFVLPMLPLSIVWLTSVYFTVIVTVDYSTRGVRLFWIFPGAPWNFNGVPGNTWGSIDVYWYNTFHKCFWFLVLLNLTHVIFLNMYWIMLVCCISHLLLALPWRHNGHDSVSNHQRYDCLLNRLSDADQRKHQSPASLAFVREIHRGPVNFPHKWPVTRKMFPFDDVIMRKAMQILIVSNQIVTNRRITSTWAIMYIHITSQVPVK